MNALIYLILIKLKNQIKSLFLKPAHLIYAIVVVALVTLSLFGARSGGDGAAGAHRDIAELTAIIPAFFTLMFILIANGGFGEGASLYKMSDVNLLFPSPVSPRSVLFYGLFQQLGTSLLLGLFILFQYTWMHLTYGVSYGAILMLMLGYAVTVFAAQLTSMLIYAFTASDEKKRRAARVVFCAVFAAFGMWLLAYAAADRLNFLNRLVEAGNSLVFRLIPIGGWTGSFVAGVITGDFSRAALGLAMILAYFAGLIILLTASRPDFYEDVIKTTETAHAKLSDAKRGQVKDAAPRRVRMGKAGLEKGFGASVFYYKHIIENRRSKTFLLSGISIVFAVVSIAFGFFLRELGILPLLAFSIYIQLFTVGLGRFIRELTKPYVYLVPDPPFKKLMWCMRESFPGFILEALMVFVPAGLIIGAPAAAIAACILARVTFSFLFLAGCLACERVFGTITVKMLVLFFYLVTLVVMALPGVALTAALMLTDTIIISAEVTVGLALSVCNIPVSVLCVFLCRNILSNAEMNT